MNTDRLRIEIERARAKATLWQGRLRELEKEKAEKENLEILQTVHSIAATPEELHAVLNQIRLFAKGAIPQNKEDSVNHE